MQSLPPALQALSAYDQFVLYSIVPDVKRPGKSNKFPLNPQTMVVSNAHDPAIWLSAQDAISTATLCGENYGVGFTFTDNDPFFFIDLDDCLQPDGQWSPIANEIMTAFGGAAIEVSQSGRGLHIIGTATMPEHSCKNTAHGLELYHTERFVALTGINIVGDASLDCTVNLPWLIERYFPPIVTPHDESWRDTPMVGWSGPEDDTVLIGKMLGAKVSAGQAFGNKCTVRELWENNEAALARAFPVQNEVDPYDRSSADASLSQHLAFWTGGNHDRMERLMRQSALVRDKWDRHPNYMQMTISGAVNRQVEFYNNGKSEPKYEATVVETLRPDVEYTTGDQRLTSNQMVDLFKGCVYIRDQHRMYTPDGSLLKAEQFKSIYGGYTFTMDNENNRDTRNAFEAFTECQAIRFPKATGTCFRPNLPSGDIVAAEGRTLVNTYTPIKTAVRDGDPSPFVNHIKALYPNGDDALIILCFIAAVVQHPGAKFQFALVQQGTEGTGKSLISDAVSFAVGRRYSHAPKASDIANKHNAWVEGCIFATIEEIALHERRDILDEMKTLITNPYVEVQPKGVDQYMADNVVKIIINTNYKAGVPITADTRRYCILYGAHQSREDVMRDFGGDYFPNLYRWMNEGGFEIVNKFLQEYEIDERYNPTTVAHVAPRTSSTSDAIEMSRGSIEQEIIEAIEEGRPGFAGGWVSGKALDTLLVKIRADRIIPRNQRRTVMQSLGYDWHPALTNGRVNNAIAVEGCKPKLFIKTGHIHANLKSGAEVTNKYIEAQNYPAMGMVPGESNDAT